MTMSNPATMSWGRPVGAMDKDGQTELETRKRRILRRAAMANAAISTPVLVVTSIAPVQPDRPHDDDPFDDLLVI